MRIMASGLQFPEGPVAMPDGSVLLVEIARETLSRVLPDGRVEVVAQVPGGPNGAAVGPNGLIYICNNGGTAWVRVGGCLRPSVQSANYTGGSIEVVTLATGHVDRLFDHCDGVPLNDPNDLVFDGSGGFWFTDMGKRRARSADRGVVYWARADGSEIVEAVAGMVTPNGIGLSPDGRTLYVAETDTGRLWSWPVTGPGTLDKQPWPSPCGGRLVAGLPGYRRFDGLAVAAGGNVCVAALESRAIAEITDDGHLVRDHPAPDLAVTNLCFGGAGMRTAFVPLSHAGQLGMAEWHEPGLALAYQDCEP